MTTVSHHRLILADPADAVRVALLGETSNWVADPGSGENTDVTWRWRTPFGLHVLISRDSLLDQLVLELAADDDAAETEASELVSQLPRVVSAVRFTDALRTFSAASSAEQRAMTLPFAAATLPDDDAHNRARVLDAAVAAMKSRDAQARICGVLAAGYLADESAAARVRALAADDPDLRVRALARRVARPPRHLARADWVRRVAFVAERVADQFLPFAAEHGWHPVAHHPGTDDESERFVWQAAPDVRCALVSDIRLERDYLVVNGANPAAADAVDQVERLARGRFPAVELDDVLGMLAEADEPADRLLLLRVAAAAAPVSHHPRMLAALAGLFGDPVTALRGFAVGGSVYYPWPEIVPLLAWSARHDPEPAIRGLADIGIDAVHRAYGGALAEMVPAVGYFVPTDGRPALLRRMAVRPTPVDQRLDGRQLWNSTVLPDDFPAGHREITFDEAGRVAGDPTVTNDGRPEFRSHDHAQ